MAPIEYSIDKTLVKALSKMKKKDLATYRAIMKQIEKVIENPEVGKPLRSGLAGLRRVHIGRSFVLSYAYDRGVSRVIFLEYDDWVSFYKRHSA